MQVKPTAIHCPRCGRLIIVDSLNQTGRCTTLCEATKK